MEEEWEELFHEKHQRKYWKSKLTGKSTWKDPKGTRSSTPVAIAEGDGKQDPSAITDEWEELFSEKHKRKYWKNKRTGEKSWKPPTAGEGNKKIETPESEANEKIVKVETADVKSIASITNSTDQQAEAKSEEWVEKFSVQHQRKYWKNTITSKSTWNNPFEKKTNETSGTMSKTGSFTSVVSVLTATETVPAPVAPAASSAWEELFSEKHKRKYWRNKETKKSTWVMPPELANPTAAVAPAPASAPAAAIVETVAVPAQSEWVELYNEKHKRKYWKNKSTGKMQWTPPPPPANTVQTIPQTPGTEEKKAEVVPAAVAPPAKLEETKPIAEKRPIVFRSVARTPFNPNGLYLFELVGPLGTTQIILHEIIDESLFLQHNETLLNSDTPIQLDGAMEEKRRIILAEITKIISNREVGSLQIILSKPIVISEGTSTEESKDTSTDKKYDAEEVVLYFHSALLAEQTYYLLQFCCKHCSPPSPYHSDIELFDQTAEHRILMNLKSSDRFVNASFLIPIPDRYVQLELLLAKYNKYFYQQFCEEQFEKEIQLSLAFPEAVQVPSIQYIKPRPLSGEKEGEVNLNKLFPLAGMIVLKVHLQLAKTEASSLTNLDTNNTQTKSGAWMPCWIQIDYASKSIAFFERGPAQHPTFKIYCQHANLRVNDMTEVQEELEIGIIDAILAETNQFQSSNDDNHSSGAPELINVSFLFKTIQDLWRWTMSFSSICSLVQWKNNDSIASMKLSKYHTLSASSSQALDQIPLRSIITDGNVLYGLESAIVDRDIIHNLIRYVSLPGYLIHHFKFFHQQQRILITSLHSKSHHHTHAGSTSTPASVQVPELAHGITDGSLLLSINGLSAVQLPGNTVLKFIADIPQEMSTDMAFIKFTSTEFLVDLIEVDHTGFVHHHFFTETSNPTSVEHHTQIARVGSYDRGVAAKKLDLESKNLLHRVLEKKRSLLLHSDPNDTRTIEEKLATISVDSTGTQSTTTTPKLPPRPKLITLQQFHLTNFEEIHWNRHRLTIANGRLQLNSVQETGPNGSDGLDVHYTIGLNRCQIKVLIHQNKDSNDIQSLQQLCLEIVDQKYHLIINCLNFRLFRSLLRAILFGMKLYGALPLDLPYIYSQSEKWKIMKQRGDLSFQNFPDGKTSGDVGNAPNIDETLYKERVRKAANKFSTSGILQQAALLATMEEEKEGKQDEFEHDEGPGPPPYHRKGKDGSSRRRESVIMNISTVLDDDNDEYRSRSLLQAAESLEETLSSLELPLVFPTPTVIDQNLQELRAMNRTNHQLIAELMTLQHDAMNPSEHLLALQLQQLQQSSAQNNQNPVAQNKNPYQGYGDTNTSQSAVDDQYGENTGDDDTDSVVENVNNIDEVLFSTNEPPHPPLMTPPPQGAAPGSVGQRRNSFITGNPIDISQQKPNAPKLTRRASRLSVSMDLGSTNTTVGNIIPLPSVIKPTPPKATFSLSSDDQVALKILFIHLRDNPADLISTATKIPSVSDLMVYAYILIHRIYGQFSSDSLRLCDLIDVAVKYENPLLTNNSGKNSSENNANTSPLSNPLAASVPNLISGNNAQSTNYMNLDEFTTTASLMSSAVSRAAGIVNAASGNAVNTPGSAVQPQNYHSLYFNEFIQYFSYSVKSTTNSFQSQPPGGSFLSPFKPIAPAAATSSSHHHHHPSTGSKTPAIQSNTLLLLILYEVSQRLDVMAFIETLCEDIHLSQIQFPSNMIHPNNPTLHFMISIHEICQYLINPIIHKLDKLLANHQVPMILLLMMKKLSTHYAYERHYQEYLYALLIPFVLHKIMIYYRMHYDENNPIHAVNHQMSQQLASQLNGMNVSGLSNNAANFMSGGGFAGAANNNPYLFMQEEQLIYMIQYIKQILLLCFQSASATSSAGTGASVGSLGGGGNASSLLGGVGNNSIQIHQKTITLSLADIAVLSKSKWLLSRCFERITHLIEDLNRQNIHNYSITGIQNAIATSGSNIGGGGHHATHKSPLASLSYLQASTGKSKIIDGFLCLRPSELLFLLQLFDFSNLTSSSLMISSSRQLSQAITVLQTTDIVGRLSFFAHAVPSNSNQSNVGNFHVNTRKSYQRLSIDREMAILLEVDFSVSSAKYDGVSSAVNPSSGGSVLNSSNKGSNPETNALAAHKSWADLLFDSHANTASGVHSHSLDQVSGGNAMLNSPSTTANHLLFNSSTNTASNTNKNLNQPDGNSLFDADSQFFLLPESTLLTNPSTATDTLLLSADSNELQAIQWLINTARITLQYVYENISNLSLQKSKSIIKELSDIHNKLVEKKKIITFILQDYSKLLMNKEILFHEKLLLQFSYDLLQYNAQINLQLISGGTRVGRSGGSGSGGGGGGIRRSGSIVMNPMNLMMPTFSAGNSTNPSLSASVAGGGGSGLISSSNYYYDIYYAPLQFLLLRMISLSIYQDYYQAKFHYYAEEEKEGMIEQIVFKSLHLEKELSVIILTQQQTQPPIHQLHSSQPPQQYQLLGQTKEDAGNSSGNQGLLAQRVQQQKGIFGSSTVHAVNNPASNNYNQLEEGKGNVGVAGSNNSNKNSAASSGVLPMTGGMNPLRVIMQSVFNSSSSSGVPPPAASVPSPKSNNNHSNPPSTLYTRRIHY